MRNLISVLLLWSCFSVTAYAQEEGQDANRRPPRPPQEVVQQFDTDGDGRLNRDERRALRQSRQANGQFGQNGQARGQFGQGQGQGERMGPPGQGQGGCRGGRGGRGGGGGGRGGR